MARRIENGKLKLALKASFDSLWQARLERESLFSTHHIARTGPSRHLRDLLPAVSAALHKSCETDILLVRSAFLSDPSHLGSVQSNAISIGLRKLRIDQGMLD